MTCLNNITAFTVLNTRLTRGVVEQRVNIVTLLHDGLISSSGPGSAAGTATGYGLDGPGIESWWEARFSAPVQTGSVAHPASCIMGTGSFLGVKSGRGVTLTPHPF